MARKLIFLEYIAYMYSKGFKPCTMNLRLRTLKCYLRSLYTEKIITEDISSKVKLVKIPKDTKEPSTTHIYVNLDNSHLINSHNKINVISKFI